MKVLRVSLKADKSDHVTIGEARSAARAVKAKRVASKSKGASAKQYQVLHEKYLGEIVHTGGSSGSKGAGRRASSASETSRTPAKKK